MINRQAKFLEILKDIPVKNRRSNYSKSSRKQKRKFIKTFRQAANQNSAVQKYQFWRHDNKPIELWSNKVIKEKIDYIHRNPVESGLVFRAEDYMYSSATDYAGEKGLLENIVFAF